MQVDLGPGHFVLDGDPAPLPPKGQLPQFSAHICCGQMAGCIKMPLGAAVGLHPSNTVLDGDRATLPKKWHNLPHFGHILRSYTETNCGQSCITFGTIFGSRLIDFDFIEVESFRLPLTTAAAPITRLCTYIPAVIKLA